MNMNQHGLKIITIGVMILLATPIDLVYSQQQVSAMRPLSFKEAEDRAGAASITGVPRKETRIDLDKELPGTANMATWRAVIDKYRDNAKVLRAMLERLKSAIFIDSARQELRQGIIAALEATEVSQTDLAAAPPATAQHTAEKKKAASTAGADAVSQRGPVSPPAAPKGGPTVTVEELARGADVHTWRQAVVTAQGDPEVLQQLLRRLPLEGQMHPSVRVSIARQIGIALGHEDTIIRQVRAAMAEGPKDSKQDSENRILEEARHLVDSIGSKDGLKTLQAQLVRRVKALRGKDQQVFIQQVTELCAMREPELELLDAIGGELDKIIDMAGKQQRWKDIKPFLARSLTALFSHKKFHIVGGIKGTSRLAKDVRRLVKTKTNILDTWRDGLQQIAALDTVPETAALEKGLVESFSPYPHLVQKIRIHARTRIQQLQHGASQTTATIAAQI